METDADYLLLSAQSCKKRIKSDSVGVSEEQALTFMNQWNYKHSKTTDNSNQTFKMKHSNCWSRYQVEKKYGKSKNNRGQNWLARESFVREESGSTQNLNF